MNDLLINAIGALVLGPVPIWQDVPDVGALFASSSPAVEQQAAAPVTPPSIDSLLALPSGFRAPGYEALSSLRTVGGDTRFDLTAREQWPGREDEIRIVPVSSNSVAGN